MRHLRTFTLCLMLAGSMVFLWECNGTTAPDYTSLGNDLEIAYQTQSEQALMDFFLGWQLAVPGYSEQRVAGFQETVRHAYYVFRAFYSPMDLDRITGGHHENFESSFQFIVIQNTFQVSLVDTISQAYFPPDSMRQEFMINDFRPPGTWWEMPVVYLTAAADSMIFQFLYSGFGERKPDHQDRVDFLRNAIQLTHHHWIPDYHKVTMPKVSRVYLNTTFAHARVNFRVFYQFGEAYLTREGNTWILKESRLTAIE